MNPKGESPALKPRDPDFVGSDVAMLRAAERARRRAEEAVRAAASGGVEDELGEIRWMNTGRDPRERGSRKTE